MSRTVFAVPFVVCAGGYLLLLLASPAPSAASVPAAVLKGLPIVLLAARALLHAPPAQRVSLALGLLFSLGGDVILALRPDDLFLAGIGAFFAAHVCYILTFRHDRGFSRQSMALAVVAVVWCVAAASILFPRLDDLREPVAAYMAVVAAMGLSAAFTTRARLALFSGAFAFIVSDTLLAFNRFVTPFSLAPLLVMLTYYLAQFLIVDAIVIDRSSSGNNSASRVTASTR